MNQPTFARGTTLGIVLVGALAFAVVLYWLGTGGGATNNGGGHAGGRGLNGYAGLAAMLQADGVKVNRARGKDALKGAGLVILTPPADAKGDDIAAIINDRRYIGPTMVIAPKWRAYPDKNNPKMRRGWTRLVGTESPDWKNYHDDLSVSFSKTPAGGWRGTGAFAEQRGALPDDRQVQSGEGPALESLIETSGGRTLAGYVVADGNNSVLDRWIGIVSRDEGNDGEIDDSNEDRAFPVVLVFEPDAVLCHGAVCRRMAQLQPLWPGPPDPARDSARQDRAGAQHGRADPTRRAHAARCRALCRCLARTAGSGAGSAAWPSG